jgi:hypothetical protein
MSDGKQPKKAVDYSPSKGLDRCGNCNHFEREKPNHCTKVEGIINRDYWCKKYKKGSGEMFSLRNGKRVDAHIHDPILSGVDQKAELGHRIESYRHVIDLGIDPKVAAKMYDLNIPDETDVLEVG